MASVATQSFREFEVIMIDDASTDHTRKIIETAAQRDQRIKPIFLQENVGLTRARNIGLKYASGQFVAFLDGDDLWTKNALELRLELSRRFPGAGVYATDFALFSSNERPPMEVLIGKVGLGSRARRTFKSAWENNAAVLLSDPFESVATIHFAWVGATLVRRDALSKVGNFDESFKGPEDTLLWLKLAREVAFVFSPEITALYRQRPGSLITQWKGPKELQYLKVLQLMQKDSKSSQSQREIMRRLEGECHMVAHLWLHRNGRNIEATSHALSALRLTPGVSAIKAVVRSLLRRERQPSSLHR